MIIAGHSLSEVLKLDEQGLYLQAYGQAQSLGPLEQWEGTDSRLVVGWLASQLGGQRLRRRLHRRAWREDRTHPGARYCHARIRLERSGPLAAWELLRHEGELTEAAPELRAV